MIFMEVFLAGAAALPSRGRQADRQAQNHIIGYAVRQRDRREVVQTTVHNAARTLCLVSEEGVEAVAVGHPEEAAVEEVRPSTDVKRADQICRSGGHPSFPATEDPGTSYAPCTNQVLEWESGAQLRRPD